MSEREFVGLPSPVAGRAGAGGCADNGVFPSQADTIFEAIASNDKEYVTLPGDHYFVEPAPARDQVADLVAEWINAR